MTLANNQEICESSRASYRIDVVDSVHLPVVWPHISDFLEKALDPFTTLEAMFYTLEQGGAKLWVVTSDKVDGCVVTGVINGTGAIINCGGKDIKNWLHLLDVIENDFRADGCTKYQFAGREGWSKLMQYDDKTTLYTKVLWPTYL